MACAKAYERLGKKAPLVSAQQALFGGEEG
jgi:hypothetical protein